MLSKAFRVCKMQIMHLFAWPLLSIKRRKENFMTTNISDRVINIDAYWDGNEI